MGKELTKTERKIINLLTHVIVRNGRLVEAQNSVAAFIVGVVFILDEIVDGQAAERFEQVYHDIDFLPAWVWGAVLIIAAVFHWLTLLLNRQSLRENVLLVKGAMWWFLAFIVLHHAPFDIEGYLYAIFGVSALLAFLSLILDKRFSVFDGIDKT